VFGPLSVLAQRLILLSGLISAVSAAYLIYGVAAGHLSHFPFDPAGRSLPPATREHLQQVVTTTTQLMLWASWVAMLLTIARYYDQPSASYVLAAAGTVCYLGLPLAVAKLLDSQQLHGNMLINQTVTAYLAVGKSLLIAAAVWLVVLGVVRIWRRPAMVSARRAPVRLGRAVVGRLGLLSPCWDLSRCSSQVRSTCPNLRDHRSCWKRAAGCYCDQRLAQRLMQSRDQAITLEIAALLAHVPALATHPGPKPALAVGQRLCHRCPIYLEHQDRKYRSLYWLAYPATALLIFAFLGPLHSAYLWVLGGTERLLHAISFSPPPSARDVWASLALSANFEWVVLTVLALIVVTYLLQGIEYCIFEWKI